MDTPPSRPRVVVVDGLISAGKSTLITQLARWLGERGKKVMVVKEPVDDWVKGGHLQAFYEGVEDGKVCYIFQTYAHVTRIKAFNAPLYSILGTYSPD